VRIVSWNVNGLRAVMSRGDLAWAFGDVDVLCLQETKLQGEQLTDALRAPAPGYVSFWSFHETKKGYSGTSIFCRAQLSPEPFSLRIGGPDAPDFDREGRVTGVRLQSSAGPLVVLSVYFPNGGSSDERLAFKHAWHDAFTEAVVALAQTGTMVIVAGDFNVAHTDLDLALPQQWAGVSGCLPVERAWFDRLVGHGFTDTFRAEKGDLPRQFTFWETRVDARSINQGWRIDYVVVSAGLEDALLDAWISPQIFGSDHCPVGCELDVHVASADTATGELSDTDGELVDDQLDEDEDDDGASRWRR